MAFPIHSTRLERFLDEMVQVNGQLEKVIKDTSTKRFEFVMMRNRYQNGSKPIQDMNKVLQDFKSWHSAEKRFDQNLQKMDRLTRQYLQVGGNSEKLITTLYSVPSEMGPSLKKRTEKVIQAFESSVSHSKLEKNKQALQ